MATLTNTKIADTYKLLLKAGSTSIALASGSGSSERLVFGEDDDPDNRTALYVTQDRLGIGTATPDTLLEVDGVVADDTTIDIARFSSYSAGTAPYLLISGDRDDGTVNNHNISLQVKDSTSGTARYLSLQPSGSSVGIGTKTPTATLQVFSGSTDLVSVFNSNDDNAHIQISDNDDDLYIGTEGIADGTETGFIGFTAAATGVAQIIINENGKVGIGVPAPVNTLEVFGNVRVGEAGGEGGGNWSRLELGCQHIAASAATNYSPRIEGGSDNSTNTLMRFYTSSNERMRIEESGKVGINETNPGVTLDVAGLVAIGNQTAVEPVSGVLTISQSYHDVDSEGSSGADTITQIVGGVTGTIVVFGQENAGRNISFAQTTGSPENLYVGLNASTATTITMTNTSDKVMFIKTGSGNWAMITSNDNL